MGCRETILDENRQYWTGRASGYSEVNQLELATQQRQKWSECLHAEIARQFPDRAPESLRVLEVGTGPGFFAILLRELGYDVTAIDLTPAMLEEAKKNAGELAGRICWMEMNAEALDFADESFDVVVSRNLTWNLPHPDKAYAEWARVLKPGGLLLNFDANWYRYLWDEEARLGHSQDREKLAAADVRDETAGTDVDAMEAIARKTPLSRRHRPQWDLEVLESLGIQAAADEQIWRRVWTREERINNASTPMFLVEGRKAKLWEN